MDGRKIAIKMGTRGKFEYPWYPWLVWVPAGG